MKRNRCPAGHGFSAIRMAMHALCGTSIMDSDLESSPLGISPTDGEPPLAMSSEESCSFAKYGLSWKTLQRTPRSEVYHLNSALLQFDRQSCEVREHLG